MRETYRTVRRFLATAAALGVLLCALLPASALAASTRTMGDINGDSLLNAMDALLLYSYTSGQMALNKEALAVADMDGNGSINMLDAVRLYFRISGAIGSPEDELPDVDPDEDSYTNDMFLLVNEARAEAGLSKLLYAAPNQELADIRAAELHELASHTRPDGTDFTTVFTQAGVAYTQVGENAAAQSDSAEHVFNAWMASEASAANILNADFTHAVVGYNNHMWILLLYTPA